RGVGAKWRKQWLEVLVRMIDEVFCAESHRAGVLLGHAPSQTIQPNARQEVRGCERIHEGERAQELPADQFEREQKKQQRRNEEGRFVANVGEQAQVHPQDRRLRGAWMAYVVEEALEREQRKEACQQIERSRTCRDQRDGM